MALSTENKIVVALGVLALLGGGLYVQQKSVNDDAQAHSAAGKEAALPDVKLSSDDADKVTKLSIRNAGKPEVVLEKKDGKWQVTAPVVFPANQQNVKLAIDNLKELKVKDSIDPGTGQYATYELDEGKAVRVQAWKDGATAADLWFGKSGSRGQMFRIGGKDGVFIASGWSKYLFDREVKAWRDGKILELDDANVVSVAIETASAQLSFSRNGEAWSATNKGAKLDDFDDAKVKDMLRAYKALAAEDFADDKSIADTGLDKPEAKVVFTLKDGAGTPTVLVGKTATGTSRYVKSATSDVRYVISGWAAEWATGGASKFQKTAADAGATAEAKDKPKKK